MGKGNLEEPPRKVRRSKRKKSASISTSSDSSFETSEELKALPRKIKRKKPKPKPKKQTRKVRKRKKVKRPRKRAKKVPKKQISVSSDEIVDESESSTESEDESEAEPENAIEINREISLLKNRVELLRTILRQKEEFAKEEIKFEARESRDRAEYESKLVALKAEWAEKRVKKTETEKEKKISKMTRNLVRSASIKYPLQEQLTSSQVTSAPRMHSKIPPNQARPSQPLHLVSNQSECTMTALERENCLTVLKTMIGHPDGWPFLQPVDPVKLGIPHYPQIITHPMDLGTIQTRLKRFAITKTSNFIELILLVFKNAKKFNPKGNIYHRMADTLETLFLHKIAHWRQPCVVKMNVQQLLENKEAEKKLSKRAHRPTKRKMEFESYNEIGAKKQKVENRNAKTNGSKTGKETALRKFGHQKKEKLKQMIMDLDDMEPIFDILGIDLDEEIEDYELDLDSLSSDKLNSLFKFCEKEKAKDYFP